MSQVITSQLTTNSAGLGEALLVIADIRGYTPFMKSHWRSLAHAQDIVARLLEAVIDAAPGLTPLEIEGDAAFFYAWSSADGTVIEGLAEQVVAMHRAFHARQQEMCALNTCTCEGCRQTGQLHVKFVAHVGEVAVQRVKHSEKLAGLGVILVHRMLKAAVPVPEYLLLSDPLFRATNQRPLRERARYIEEDLAGLGPTAMHVVDLSEVATELPPRSRVTRLAQARENFGVIRRSLPYLLGLRRPRVAL
jgi:class 3 adenylate cyclase